MVRVRITRNYQVTIPALVRKAVGLKVGDVVEVYADEEGRIVIEKVRGERKKLRAGRKLSPEEIEELIERGLRRSIEWL